MINVKITDACGTKNKSIALLNQDDSVFLGSGMVNTEQMGAEGDEF